MDTFDALMTEVSQKAQEDGISFDEALLSALSESSEEISGENQLPAAQGMPDVRIPVVTPEVLAQTLKSMMPQQIDAVLPTSGWEESGDAAYPYVCIWTHPGLTQRHRTYMYIYPDSWVAAQSAGICPVTDTQDGCVKILSEKQPAEDMIVSFVTSMAR